MSELQIYNNSKSVTEWDSQDFTAEEIVAKIEKVSEVVKQMNVVALRGTSPEDWTDQGGKPYLTISGANKVKNIFGISVLDSTWQKTSLEDDAGHYYVVTFQATFTWKLASTTMTGTCSSRDKFFGKDKPMESVDFTNVLKKAETNCYGRGIKALLGITNLTWEYLEEITKWKRDKVAKVEYRDKTVVSDAMKEKQAKLRKLVMAQAENDVEKARGMLELLTEWTDKTGKTVAGKREISALTEKQLDICIKKLEEK